MRSAKNLFSDKGVCGHAPLENFANLGRFFFSEILAMSLGLLQSKQMHTYVVARGALFYIE